MTAKKIINSDLDIKGKIISNNYRELELGKTYNVGDSVRLTSTSYTNINNGIYTVKTQFTSDLSSYSLAVEQLKLNSTWITETANTYCGHWYSGINILQGSIIEHSNKIYKFIGTNSSEEPGTGSEYVSLSGTSGSTSQNNIKDVFIAGETLVKGGIALLGTDGKIYSKGIGLEFIGFVEDNTISGNNCNIIVNGFADLFTGVLTGEKYGITNQLLNRYFFKPPIDTTNMTFASSGNGFLYGFGGASNKKALKFNTSTKEYEYLLDVPYQFSASIPVSTVFDSLNNKIHIFGTIDLTIIKHLIYDISTNTYSVSTDLTVSPYTTTSISSYIYNGFIYVTTVLGTTRVNATKIDLSTGSISSSVTTSSLSITIDTFTKSCSQLYNGYIYSISGTDLLELNINTLAIVKKASYVSTINLTARGGISSDSDNFYIIGGTSSNKSIFKISLSDFSITTINTLIPFGLTDYSISSCLYSGIVYTFHTNGVILFDTINNSISDIKNIPYTLQESCSIGTNGGNMFTYSGFGSGVNDGLRMYSSSFNTRTKKNNPTIARYGASFSYDGNDKIYLIGGIISGSPTNSIEVYTISTNSWSTLTNMTTARGYMGNTLPYYNGKIYAIGGYTGSASGVNESYDIIGNSWSTLTNMTTARYKLSSTEVNGVIYCIGGYTTTDVSTIEAYNISGNSWTSKTSLILTSTEHISYHYNGYIFSILGGTQTNTNMGYIHIFDITNNITKAISLGGTAGAIRKSSGALIGTKIYFSNSYSIIKTSTYGYSGVTGYFDLDTFIISILGNTIRTDTNESPIYNYFGGNIPHYYNNKIYIRNTIIGNGFGNGIVYDINSGALSEIKGGFNLNYQLSGNGGMSIGIGNSIYSLGNDVDTTYITGTTRKLIKYNIDTNVYEYKTNCPVNFIYGSVCTIGNKIYAIGGSAVNTNFYVYDTDLDTWTSLAALPNSMFYGRIVSFNGYVYLFGGRTASAAITSIYRYDTVNNSWYLLKGTLNSTQTGNTNIPLVFVANSKAYIIMNSSPERGYIYEYDFGTESIVIKYILNTEVPLLNALSPTLYYKSGLGLLMFNPSMRTYGLISGISEKMLMYSAINYNNPKILNIIGKGVSYTNIKLN